MEKEILLERKGSSNREDKTYTNICKLQLQQWLSVESGGQ